MEMSKHKRFLVGIGLGFLMAGIVALSLDSLCDIRYRLVRNPMPARGLVTTHPDPENRGVSSYAGTADPRTSATEGYPHVAEAEPVAVLYLPYDAAVNRPGDARG
jgi:hypothetical protein